MKKIVSLLMAVCLALVMAVPAGALGIVPGDFYNESYSYCYIDYNGDGKMELVTHGGEPGGYAVNDIPEYKIYTYADGEVKLFTPSDGNCIYSTPLGYRNWLTRKFKWYYVNGDINWAGVQVYEVSFDFQDLQYSEARVRNFQTMYFGNIRYYIWKLFWKVENGGKGHQGEGVLTPEVIEELILNPPSQ